MEPSSFLRSVSGVISAAATAALLTTWCSIALSMFFFLPAILLVRAAFTHGAAQYDRSARTAGYSYIYHARVVV
jgi:antibiotic biosynthesis monooxygenase (ABM) superfamily enzyme